jgi:hypothetical protein
LPAHLNQHLQQFPQNSPEGPVMTEESVYDSLMGSAVRVFTKIAMEFEPLAPTAITLIVNRQMHRYKERGIVTNYKTHTKRLGKYHYKIEMDLDVTGRQAFHLLGNIFPKQFMRFRRWFHD